MESSILMILARSSCKTGTLRASTVQRSWPAHVPVLQKLGGKGDAMRILLVADIHANWPALQAIDEPHDLCFCLGDLVDYCLDPAPCLDWVRRRAHYGVRGNHDHGVAQNVVVTGRAGFKYLSGVTRVLTQ